MLAQGDAGRGVVGDDALPRVERPQARGSGQRQGKRELGDWRACALRAAAGDPQPPELVPPRRQAAGRAERPAGPRPCKALEPVSAHPGARGEVREAAVGAAVLALGDQRPGLVLGDTLDVAEPEPHRGLRRPRRGWSEYSTVLG